MKIYCSTCDKVQPVQIDDCRDAQTNEPFQDIVCKECYLVIASGTDIQRPWVGLTDEEKASFWKADQMTNSEWDQLFAEVETKLKEKNHD